MPNYEYACLNCMKKFVLFFRYDEYGKVQASCPYCESLQVQRKIGRIRVTTSSLNRLENMSDPKNLDAIDDDPRALGMMMRQMSQETGEDMGPEFDEVVHRLETGQSPEQIERDLPDLLGEESSTGTSDAFSDD
jgi:putative FmdB family regulatory protein